MPSVPVLDAPLAECRSEAGQSRDSAQAHCSMKGGMASRPIAGKRASHRYCAGLETGFLWKPVCQR